MLVQSVVLPLQVIDTLTITGGVWAGGRTPGWQQIASVITSPFGHKVVLVQFRLVVNGVGVTAATLAACLTPFLREFFLNQARANSDIPKRMSNNIKSIRAVSINVCPFCSLTISILAVKSGPREGRIKSPKKYSINQLFLWCA